MSIELTYSTTTITLDPDLFWTDEYAWSPVEQTTQRTVSGALIVSVAARAAGRPITLQPEDDSSAWITRDTLETLRSWAAVAGRQMTLTLRGTPYTVIFRHHDGSAVDAVPIQHFSDTDGDDYYRVTLRFMEV